MKKKSFFSAGKGVILLLLSITGCSVEVPLPSNEGDELDVPSYVELRASEQTLSPSRFIGRSFNVLKYPINDVRGFSNYPILSSEQSAWNPFGEGGEEFASFPDVLVEEHPTQDVVRQYHLDVSSESSLDSIVFAPSATYKQHSISYTKMLVERKGKRSHSYSSFVYLPQKKVMFDNKNAGNLSFFLDKRFVADLKRLSPKMLVQKYGTHIVTNYLLGAYMQLMVQANASNFSKDEVQKMELKLWGNGVLLPYEMRNKIERNITAISVIYRQGGSDYQPDKTLLSPSGLYVTDNAVNYLNEAEWYRQIRQGDNSFLSLDEDKRGLIAIPDVIAHIPLKVKYTVGILEQASAGNRKGLNYILCNPETFTPIRFKNQYVRANMSEYGSKQQQLFLGMETSSLLTEGLIQGGNAVRHKWEGNLDDNGIWTFKKVGSDKYLCRDFVLRTIDEDRTNLRFWGLNPMLPSPSGNVSNINWLLIQSKI